MAQLRAVSANERAPRKPLSITEAAERGTRRELLAAVRSRVARAIEDPNVQARDLAALSRRLLEITNDIELLDRAADPGAGELPEDAPFDEEKV